MKLFSKKRLNMGAQTAIELAVFGSILIFVLGLIIRQSMNAGYQQNQQLKALRYAMWMSYKHSIWVQTSRNSASVMVLEDRLTASNAKYGAIDRTPFISIGSATHSHNLFLPVEPNEPWNSPKLDLFVNGKHFAFTVADFVEYGAYDIPDRDGDGFDDPTWDPECASYQPPTWQVTPCAQPALGFYCDETCPGLVIDSSLPPQVVNNPSLWPFWYNDGISCNFRAGIPDPPVDIGCHNAFLAQVNHPSLLDLFCSEAGVDTDPLSCAGQNNLPVEERFNLDRDPAGIPDVPAAPPELRENFFWQWRFVRMISLDGQDANLTILGDDPTRDEGRGEGVSTEDNVNVSIDVDGDFKDEAIIGILDTDELGVIRRILVLDSQLGDLDFSLTTPEVKPDPEPPGFIRPNIFGFGDDTHMYTFLRDGTIAEVSEGELYNAVVPGRNFIRVAQMKDQIDIIERELLIHRNTGRFCPTEDEFLGGTTEPRGTVDSEANPIEVCCRENGLICTNGSPQHCHTEDNIFKTCMVIDTPGGPTIYVRSRILDRHGRKWVTDRSFDRTVDFEATAPGTLQPVP